MIRVQFNDSKKMIDADFKLLSENAVQLTRKRLKPTQADVEFQNVVIS